MEINACSCLFGSNYNVPRLENSKSEHTHSLDGIKLRIPFTDSEFSADSHSSRLLRGRVSLSLRLTLLWRKISFICSFFYWLALFLRVYFFLCSFKERVSRSRRNQGSMIMRGFGDQILISDKISVVVDKRELIDRCLSTSKPSRFIFPPTAFRLFLNSLEINF